MTPPSSSASLTKLGEVRSSAPERDLVQLAARAALATAWRGLNPQSRERFAQAPSPSAVDRVWYETQDGWTTPMHRVPAVPGGSGEPVILAHGLGVNRYALDFSPELSLARALSRAGFEVFLLETRADRAAIAPEGAPGFDVDDVALQDLPAAFERACQLTGARRALYVGHALGAQLLYAYAGQSGADEIAAAATLCAPVTFPRQASGARALRLALGLLPRDARLPARAAAAISAPRAGGELPGGLGVAAMSGDVARGMMMFGAEDIPQGLLRQALRWLEVGWLCDRHNTIDYTAALRGQTLPLMVVCAEGDPLCRPEQATPPLLAVRGEVELVTLAESWGHYDPLLDARAADAVFAPIVRFLGSQRARCW